MFKFGRARGFPLADKRQLCLRLPKRWVAVNSTGKVAVISNASANLNLSIEIGALKAGDDDASRLQQRLLTMREHDLFSSNDDRIDIVEMSGRHSCGVYYDVHLISNESNGHDFGSRGIIFCGADIIWFSIFSYQASNDDVELARDLLIRMRVM